MGTSGADWFHRAKWPLTVLVTLSCVAAMAAAAAPAKAVQRDVPEATSLSLSATPVLVDYGGSTTLAGRLSTQSGPVAGATLDLASSTDGTSWSEPAQVATDATGEFSVQVAPDTAYSQTLYRVDFAGSAELAPAKAQIAVQSRPDLGAPVVPLSVGRTTSFEVGGVLQPRQTAGGAPVSLTGYRREKGQWVLRQTIDVAVVDQASSSTYAATLSLPSAGTWRLRAVSAEGGVAETWSPWSRTITVTADPDAPIWNRDGVTTVPERMVNRLNARQLIVVTGSAPGARDGAVRLFDYHDGDWVRTLAVRAHFGSNGLISGLVRHAGSRTTPTGIWRLPGFVFGTHRKAPLGLSMAYRHITGRSWWSSEPNATYNTWVESTRAVSGEHLADAPVQYEFAFSTGYNAPPNPCVFGRGTAIFVHVYAGAYTAGCVALSRSNMILLVRALDPALRPACAIGTTRSGTSSCIFAY